MFVLSKMHASVLKPLVLKVDTTESHTSCCRVNVCLYGLSELFADLSQMQETWLAEGELVYLLLWSDVSRYRPVRWIYMFVDQISDCGCLFVNIRLWIYVCMKTNSTPDRQCVRHVWMCVIVCISDTT